MLFQSGTAQFEDGVCQILPSVTASASQSSMTRQTRAVLGNLSEFLSHFRDRNISHQLVVHLLEADARISHDYPAQYSGGEVCDRWDSP